MRNRGGNWRGNREESVRNRCSSDALHASDYIVNEKNVVMDIIVCDAYYTRIYRIH